MNVTVEGATEAALSGVGTAAARQMPVLTPPWLLAVAVLHKPAPMEARQEQGRPSDLASYQQSENALFNLSENDTGRTPATQEHAWFGFLEYSTFNNTGQAMERLRENPSTMDG